MTGEVEFGDDPGRFGDLQPELTVQPVAAPDHPGRAEESPARIVHPEAARGCLGSGNGETHQGRDPLRVAVEDRSRPVHDRSTARETGDQERPRKPLEEFAPASAHRASRS